MQIRRRHKPPRHYTKDELVAVANQIGDGDEDLDSEFHDENAAQILLDGDPRGLPTP